MELEYRLSILVLLNAAVLWLYGAPKWVGLIASLTVAATLLIGAVKTTVARRALLKGAS